MSDKKIRKEAEKKSLLKRVLTFGARSKAAKAPKEKYLSDKKKKQFSKAYKGR
jgi:hypothetical protein